VTVAPPYVDVVAPGVLAYVQPDGSWMLNNAGAVLGPDGVVLVDTSSTERRTRALLAAVAEESAGAPVRTLVNTHHHADHTFGNCFVDGAVRVGHELTRERVVAAGLGTQLMFPGVDYGEIVVAPPEVTFADTMTVWTGERALELSFVGPAHTPDDVLAWLPDERVAFCGDLVFSGGGTPFLLMGSVAGYPRALEAVRALGADVLVPGHGPVCRGAEVERALDDMADYASWLASYAASSHAAGWEPLEAARRADLGRFAEWGERERLVGNLARAYLELDGGAPGEVIDVAPVVAAMRDYAGGEIRCLA
jgi:glyoxylase-like metal-dependent hydrolase (beta-lactamase superfamily II)